MLPRLSLLLSVLFALGAAARGATPAVNLSGFRSEAGATVREEAPGLRVTWPMPDGEVGEIVFNLEAGRPLLERLAVAPAATAEAVSPLMQRVDPMLTLTIGERDLSSAAGWVAFFDNPPTRSYRTVGAVLTKKTVSVSSAGLRTVVRIGDVVAGSFSGVWEFTVTKNSPLVLAEAVLQTKEDGRAILYDAGLVSSAADWPALVWRGWPNAATG